MTPNSFLEYVKAEATQPTPERWEQVKSIFERASSAEGRDRPECVRRLCAGDTQLESEVNRLLALDDSAGSFLSNSAPAAAAGVSLDHTLSPDELVCGRFRILRFLNQGGMGEVYEAWDLELQEKVALKTIRPGIALSPGVIERFKREVKQARGISHPNICRVYDLFSYEQSPSRRIWFLTMQLLDGRTLLEEIREHGPVDAKRALGIVEQLVHGLAAAHKLGIVHRDFKSSNVMLVSKGGAGSQDGEPADEGEGESRAVITDFGLALNVDTDVARNSGAEGTPDYMAPEQRSGDPVGFAADQFALGVVIYEMLTGLRPARRDGDAKPNSTLLLPSRHLLPARWSQVVRRCLNENPADRFPGVTDVIGALTAHKRRRALVMRRAAIFSSVGLAAVLAAAISGTGWYQSRLEHLVRLTPENDVSGYPSLSRDGKTIAYMSDRSGAGNFEIWVQQLPSGRPVQLTRTSFENMGPDISPDGSTIVFQSSREKGGIYLAGSAPGREILLIPGGREPRFSPDGHWLAYSTGDRDQTAPSGKVYLQKLKTDVPGKFQPAGPAILVTPGFTDARGPIWSADGRYLLFEGCRAGDGSLPACFELWAVSAEGGAAVSTGALAHLRPHDLNIRNEIGVWNGKTLVFSGTRGDTSSIWELDLPEKTLRAGGEPRQVTGEDARYSYSDMSLAPSGTIAVSQQTASTHLWRITPKHNQPAEIARITDDEHRDYSPFVSPNGHWVVFCRNRHAELWKKELMSGLESRVQVSAAEVYSPLISDPGNGVIYETRDNAVPVIRLWRPNEERTLCRGCSHPSSWFDGDRAVFSSGDAPSRIYLHETSEQTSTMVLSGEGMWLDNADWSPATQYLLFTAKNAGGSNKQIFAVRFPTPEAKAIGRWSPITGDAGWNDHPRWSPDGKAIYFLSDRDGWLCLWAQAFDPHSGKTAGDPWAVMHFHSARSSPSRLPSPELSLGIAGDSIIMDRVEIVQAIWAGTLKRPFFSQFEILSGN